MANNILSMKTNIKNVISFGGFCNAVQFTKYHDFKKNLKRKHFQCYSAITMDTNIFPFFFIIYNMQNFFLINSMKVIHLFIICFSKLK